MLYDLVPREESDNRLPVQWYQDAVQSFVNSGEKLGKRILDCLETTDNHVRGASLPK